MVMENIFIKINLNFKELGFVINNTDLEYKHGQMEQDFKVIFFMVLKKDLVNLLGMMVLCMRDNFNKTCLMELENIFGMIKNNMQVNGKIIKYMEKE